MSLLLKRRIVKIADGFRGGVLVLIGLPWATVGISHVMTTTEQRSDGFGFLPTWLDQNELGWVWIVAGLVAALCGIAGKYHPRWTTLGFSIATVPAALWSVVYLLSFLMGTPYSSLGLIAYGLITALIYFCSGWPNPPTTMEKEADAGPD